MDIKTTLLPILFILIGCSVEGNLSQESKDKRQSCVDTRNNEKFSYHTNSIHNIRIHIGNITESSMDIIDNSGNVRTISKAMELYIKCSEITNQEN